MLSASQKHRNIASEPLGDKLVTDLPGIGTALGGKLANLGYDKVFDFAAVSH